MSKLLQHKLWWLLLAVLFVVIIAVSSFIHYRIDLTQEKRFTVSPSTRTLLENIDTPINVKVFLTGDLPSDYKKLSLATQDLLREFSDLSNNHIEVSFETPGEGLDDSLKLQLYDSLSRAGVQFERNEAVSTTGNKATNQLLIPSALVYYKEKPPIAIDLRSSRTIFKNYNVLNEEPQPDKEATRNAAEALLEFKFANAIDKLTRTYVPSVAYCIGNGEPTDFTVNDLGESLRNEYRLAVFDLKKGYPNPGQINALLIVKPTQSFTDEDKVKIDQYVMHGGKVLWFVDKLYAELDSLMRSRTDFIAYDRNLNLDDILFKYGVRINGDLLQDLNCSKMPVVIGYNPDNSPRMQRIPWPYYPFLQSTNNNPISKNIDRILSVFPSSIDTVKAPGITKTILLASDTNSRVLSSPALVSLNSVKTEEDFNSMNRSHIPVAVLLEGKFSSLFANRLDAPTQDSVQRATGKPFAAKATAEAKQIVVSDADLVTNAVSPANGPLPMGELPFENYRFANREFFLNSVDYLVSNNGIFESRNKDFVLRLLDKKKVAEQKTEWQMINIAVPIVLIVIFGFVFQYARRQRYGV